MPMARIRPFSLVEPCGGSGRLLQSVPATQVPRDGQFVPLTGEPKVVAKESGKASRRMATTGLLVTSSKRTSHPRIGFPLADARTLIRSEERRVGKEGK